MLQIVPLATIVWQLMELDLEAPSFQDLYDGLKLGKTQILMKAAMYEYLERLRRHVMHMIARRIRNGFLYRKKLREKIIFKSKNAGYLSQRAICFFTEAKRHRAIKYAAASVLLQRNLRALLHIKKRRRLKPRQCETTPAHRCNLFNFETPPAKRHNPC